MKNVMMIIACLFLGACAKGGHDSKLEVSGFEAQVHAFEAGAASIGIGFEVTDLVIQLDDNLASNGEDGLCVTNKDQTPVIYVSSRFWNRATDLQKEILILHEMGHCVLYRSSHNNTMKLAEDQWHQVPVSVLYYTNQGFDGYAGDYYTDHKVAYFHELFNY